MRSQVPQALGTLKGGNLFHSFASFGIERGESATFITFDRASSLMGPAP